MTFLLGFLKGIWGYVAAAGAAVLAVLMIYKKGEKTGATEVVAKTQEKELANVTKANEVELEVARTPTSDVADKLHDRWSRD